MRFAQLDEDSTVVDLIVADDAAFVHERLPGTWVCVDGLDPEPGIGWRSVGSAWEPPPETPSAQADLAAAAAVIEQHRDPGRSDPPLVELTNALATVAAAAIDSGLLG